MSDLDKIIEAIEGQEAREGWATPDRLRDYASWMTTLGCRTAAAAFNAIADLLPKPWPTTPGSTARTERWRGDDKVRYAALDEMGHWYVLGVAEDKWDVAVLRAEGFTPLHDAGADQ